MSLDVSLMARQLGPTRHQQALKLLVDHGFVAEANRYAELSDPDAPQHYFSANITHNLNAMADAAGVYKEVWRPEEVPIESARELIQPLRDGIVRLEADPEKYKKYNPSNGWGSYEGLIAFLRAYVEACEEQPDAMISVCR